MKTLAMIFCALAIFGGVIWWKAFVWQECRAVGHSTLYCASQIGTR